MEYIVRYLQVNHNLKRITKADIDFAKKINFKDIKFPVKVRRIQKLVFWVMKIRKNIQSIYQKNVVKKKMLIHY